MGLKNYQNLFHDDRILDSYLFTFKFAFVATIITNVVALAIAVGLNAEIKGRTALRGIFFIPNVLGIFIIGYIFSYMLSNSLPSSATSSGSTSCRRASSPTRAGPGSGRSWSRTERTMLHLEDHWVWDFWVVDHGLDHHVFFLKAPRALGNPDLRHRNARIGHAVSTDLQRWELLPDALGPGERGSWMTAHRGRASSYAVATAGSCSTRGRARTSAEPCSASAPRRPTTC